MDAGRRIPMAKDDLDDLSAFDAGDDFGGDMMLGGDDDTIKKINRRTSTGTRIATFVILLVAIGAGVWAFQHHQAEQVRFALLEEAGEQTDPAQRNALLRQVLEENSFEDAKQRAIMNLGHYRDESAVPLLIEALDEKGVVRRSAAWALARIGSPAADAAKAKLLEVLPDTDEVDRPRVLWTMAMLGEQDQGFIDALIVAFSEGQVQDQDDFEARVITDVLGIDRLSTAELTGHESDAVRLLTASALAENGTDRVVAPLSAILTGELERDAEDQHVEVIRAAVGGLGRAASPAAARPLFETLQNVEGMRGTVIDALKASTAAPDLAVLLSEATDVEVRRALVEVIAGSHDRRTADTLASLVNDEDLDIRSAAVLALAEFGDERAIDPLFALAAVEDNDSLVSSALEHLAFVATPAATDRLIDMIETHFHRKAAVLNALGKTGDARAVRALEKELEEDDAPTAALALAMIGDERSFRRLHDTVPRPRDRDMAAYNAADRSVANEDLLRARKGAIIAMGRFGHPEAIETLMTVVEDDNDDYELRGRAAAAIGMLADTEAMRQVIAKVRDTSISEHARRYYVQALWQRPHPELTNDLLGLLQSNAPAEVRRSAALAVGYAADPAADERLIAMLDNEATRRDAAFAIVLGGSDEAVQALMGVLAEDRDTAEVLQMSVTNEENDWFNLVTASMFESGAIWRRANAARLLRQGIDDNTYSYAWQKVVQVLRSGWEGVGGITPGQVRDELWEAISGTDEANAATAAEILGEMPERGLLLRARDEGGQGGEIARSVLTSGRTG